MELLHEVFKRIFRSFLKRTQKVVVLDNSLGISTEILSRYPLMFPWTLPENLQNSRMISPKNLLDISFEVPLRILPEFLPRIAPAIAPKISAEDLGFLTGIFFFQNILSIRIRFFNKLFWKLVILPVVILLEIPSEILPGVIQEFLQQFNNKFLRRCLQEFNHDSFTKYSRTSLKNKFLPIITPTFLSRTLALRNSSYNVSINSSRSPYIYFILKSSSYSYYKDFIGNNSKASCGFFLSQAQEFRQ